MQRKYFQFLGLAIVLAALSIQGLVGCVGANKVSKMADDAPIRVRSKSGLQNLNSGSRLIGVRSRDGKTFIFTPQQREVDGRQVANFLVPIDSDRALLIEFTRASGPKEPMTAGQCWLVQAEMPPQRAQGIFIFDDTEVRGNVTFSGQELQIYLAKEKIQNVDVVVSGKSGYSFSGFEELFGKYGLDLRRVR